MKQTTRYFDQSIQLQKATAFLQIGSLNDAKNIFENLLSLDSTNIQYLNALGLIKLQQGRLEEGIQLLCQSVAINPNQPTAHYNRGLALKDLTRLDEAIDSFDYAIALLPNYAIAHNNRGIVLTDLSRLKEAIASFDCVITLQPDNPEAHSNRGVALAALNQLEEAITSYDRAVALKPDYAEAYANRGAALAALNRLEEAITSYDNAIALKPDYELAHNNKGDALTLLNRLEEAMASCDRAIALKPDYAEAHNNKGNALAGLNRIEEANASYDRAIALKPDYAEAYWNKSLLKILVGEYQEGWKLYEWRHNIGNTKQYNKFYKPLWLGDEDLLGKTILVSAEQGLGDIIQFCRYVSILNKVGAKVILEVPKALLSLVKTLQGNVEIIEQGQQSPHFDYYCPIMSLPRALDTTIKTIPSTVPYLYSEKNKIKLWNKKLGKKIRPRVGLVWSGSKIHKKDKHRSLLLKQLENLLKLPFEFHSLQKEIRHEDKKTLVEFNHIHQHQDELHDFSDTAALIEAMDIVISVDTSIVHLAGAMNKNVWLLLPYAPDFRWMLDRSDSPWYPTATLFRQSIISDWDTVIAKVTQQLEKLYKDK